jgi:hypothetical protein
MNPLNKTAVINPPVRQDAESKNPATPSPVVIQSSLASRIPTHQVSPDSPRSLSSYAVTPIAEDSTEAKASSSSSSSSPSRIISSASSSSSPLVETHQRVQIHQEELIGLHHRSRISEEEKAAVCRELQGRMSEVINAPTTTNPAQPAAQMLTLSLLARLTANSDVRAAEFWATLGAAGRAAVVATATNPTTLAEPSVLAVLAVLAELAVAQKALNLLTHLTADSDDRAAQLWTTLGDAGRGNEHRKLSRLSSGNGSPEFVVPSNCRLWRQSSSTMDHLGGRWARSCRCRGNESRKTRSGHASPAFVGPSNCQL